jgi:hypothetical protein
MPNDLAGREQRRPEIRLSDCDWSLVSFPRSGRGASRQFHQASVETLADINKDIQKKGPVDTNEGRRYSGSCLGKLSVGIRDKDWWL